MIEQIAYQPRWPDEFEAVAAGLLGILGDRALAVDHIGSTAVPGLASKDIIDVQITVADLTVADALAAAGYRESEGARDHRPPGADGPDSDWEKRFFHPPEGVRHTNIHVRAEGRPNQRYALLFRDYLRAHPEAAAAYAETKRQLARYHGEDRMAYVTIKDPVCDVIMAAAERWANS